MRAGVPFNRRSSSPNGNNPTSKPSSRAQNRRGCFPHPSHLCQAEIHSQERNGDALVALNSACHSGANDDRASAPLNSSTTNLLTSIPHHRTNKEGEKNKRATTCASSNLWAPRTCRGRRSEYRLAAGSTWRQVLPAARRYSERRL